MVAERSPSRTVLPMHRRDRCRSAVVQKRCVSTAAPGRLRPIVGRAEQAAQHRTQPHDFEVRPADDARANDARLAEADHRELDGGEVAEGASSVLTRARRSRISGTEKFAFSTPMPGALWRM